jgi:hypothetical protein
MQTAKQGSADKKTFADARRAVAHEHEIRDLGTAAVVYPLTTNHGSARLPHFRFPN